jgi:hypothetical protein
MLVEKRLGQRRAELTDELYQTWRELERRGLKETPEYRDVLLSADRHALWIAELVQLAPPLLFHQKQCAPTWWRRPKKPLNTTGSFLSSNPWGALPYAQSQERYAVSASHPWR